MEIKEWHLTRENLSHLHAKLSKTDFSKRWVVTCREAKTKRTIDQNSLYWKFLTEFGNYLGYHSEELHDILRRKFLFKVINFEGKEEVILLSTTKQDTKSMAEYYSKCLDFAAEHGFIFDESI